MKNAAVIFHSLCGNTMGMAKYYEKAFLDEGFAVGLFRTPDPEYERDAAKLRRAMAVKEELTSLPVIDDVDLLESYDAIAMGCPVYFGNVSAQMKAFMDSFYDLNEKEIYMSGKYFLSFVSCTNFAGDGVRALEALNSFAMHQGMIVVSVPPKTQYMPPYGCIHYSGPGAASPPDYTIFSGIRRHVNRAAAAMSDPADLARLVREIGERTL